MIIKRFTNITNILKIKNTSYNLNINYYNCFKPTYFYIYCQEESGIYFSCKKRKYHTLTYKYLKEKDIQQNNNVQFFIAKKHQEFFLHTIVENNFSSKPPYQLLSDFDGTQGELKVDSKVVELTDVNLDEFIGSEIPTLVMFYAPWCNHCRQMMPEYEKLAEILIDEHISARTAILDCTKNTEITEKFKIVGFPTIKFFKSGKYLRDYNGSRTSNAMKKFILENTPV